MIRMSFDFSKIHAKLDQIAEQAREAARPAAQAGAQVFYDEVRARAPVGSKDEHYFYGMSAKKAPKGAKKARAYAFTRGNLRNSVYQYRLRHHDEGLRVTYVVSWNHKEAPYGAMVEYGTSRAAAKPFLRPAFDAAQGRANGAVKKTMMLRIKQALKK